ncbi:AlbA family DNA-binding domain-containing protein [Burkholderia gladioli]|uniref:AlbA family DNA-binding domain-containing protein n=1 Tax=Burkholderia gladioli TaxID=28095 RepID=UPI001641DA77|nr:ATP-binding protein [Burkholderia gladioli]
MYETIADIEALQDVAFESVNLEFKAGAKLENWNERAKLDFIVDVTAFANAGGGVVIYGLNEIQRDGRSYAGDVSPVRDTRLTQDRLREVIVSNTDPVLRGFTIAHIQVDGGSIFVVSVDEGDTAYQNTCDRKYYGRIDASSQPMHGFAIRDVMNRRTRPHVTASLSVRSRRNVEAGRREYELNAILSNDGNLTARHWALRVAIPRGIGTHEGSFLYHLRPDGGDHINGLGYQWYRYSSERSDGRSYRILPGEILNFREIFADVAVLLLSVGSREQRRVMDHSPSVYWELLVDDAPKQKGELLYADWCDF